MRDVSLCQFHSWQMMMNDDECYWNQGTPSFCLVWSCFPLCILLAVDVFLWPHCWSFQDSPQLADFNLPNLKNIEEHDVCDSSHHIISYSSLIPDIHRYPPENLLGKRWHDDIRATRTAPEQPHCLPFGDVTILDEYWLNRLSQNGGFRWVWKSLNMGVLLTTKKRPL